MKVLRQSILFAALVIGFALTASAQRQDDKKPPPKENRPTIPVKPKNDEKKPDKPKDDKNDRRRPGMALAISSDEEESA